MHTVLALAFAALISLLHAAGSQAACLYTRSNVVPIIPGGAELSLNLTDNQVADGRGATLFANPPKYPLVIRKAAGDTCVTDLKILGTQAHVFTWQEMKKRFDGDGVLFKRYTGTATVENLWLENVMDGISPRAANDNSPWIVRSTYARYIRDDFIENDQCLPGTVEDVLVDGTFVFISTRPGSRQPCAASHTTVIRQALVRLECQPYADAKMKKDGCNAGTGHGQLWKWSPKAGPVAVTDSLFVVPGQSVNGPKAMGFPPGIYSNVTLVWLGNGPYPATIPDGVRVTTDRAAWDHSRREWLARHGCDVTHGTCRFDRQAPPADRGAHK
jgi:hypothetical protein